MQHLRQNLLFFRFFHIHTSSWVSLSPKGYSNIAYSSTQDFQASIFRLLNFSLNQVDNLNLYCILILRVMPKLWILWMQSPYYTKCLGKPQYHSRIALKGLIRANRPRYAAWKIYWLSFDLLEAEAHSDQFVPLSFLIRTECMLELDMRLLVACFKSHEYYQVLVLQSQSKLYNAF